MSKPIFPATVSLVISALALMPYSAFADDGVAVTFVETFQRDEASLPVSAVGLRPTAVAETTSPTDVIVLVDTSANQSGEHRANATRALTAFLDKARDDEE